MAHYFTRSLLYHLLVLQAIMLAVAITNTHRLRRARRHGSPDSLPKVSILVPARNEEAGIERCVRSLLAQDYPDFEVLVLDDESVDGTQTILQRLAREDPRLQVLGGRPLGAGWLGKNWACAQLAEHANSELLLFTDADTFHQPHALRTLVAVMQGEQADLLTGFPRQEVITWGERLLVPFFSWVVYCFVPLELAYRLRWPALSTAVGQVLLFRRAAYEGIGGHQTVRDRVAEDLALAQCIKARGLRWRMSYLADLVGCRMYRTGREAVAGFSKNLFSAFGFRIIPYVWGWVWLAVVFWQPLIALGLYVAGAEHVSVGAALASIGLSLLLWGIPYLQLRLPVALVACYPLSALALAAVALRSMALALWGGASWKGRALARPRVRLF